MSEEEQVEQVMVSQPVANPVSTNPQASGSGSVTPAVPQQVQANVTPLNFSPHGAGIYNKDDTAAVTRSTSVLRGLPRSRLTASLEKLDPEDCSGCLLAFVRPPRCRIFVSWML